MRYRLNNEYLMIEVESLGAELKSVQNKATGQEYMWQADPAFLCIEPWCGRCDAVNYAGSLEEREFSNRLGKGQVFETSYKMIFQ